jgi:hypothetical protein
LRELGTVPQIILGAGLGVIIWAISAGFFFVSVYGHTEVVPKSLAVSAEILTLSVGAVVFAAAAALRNRLPFPFVAASLVVWLGAFAFCPTYVFLSAKPP